MRKKLVSPFIRAQAVALYNNTKFPMSMDEVAKQLNISKKYMYNPIKKYEENGEFMDKECSGRPPKLGERPKGT